MLPTGSQCVTHDLRASPSYSLTSASTWIAYTLSRNGELKEYIAAGTSKDEFARRVQSILQPIASPAAVTNQPVQAPATSSSPQAVARTEDPSAESSPGQATPPSSSESQAAQSIQVEQAARLAAQRKRDEEVAKLRHAEEKKAKEAAAAAAGPADPSSKDVQTKKHSDLLKKKQKEAREERQRILKSIQDDKAERHARQAELEAERQAAAATASPSADAKGKGKESTATKPQPRSSTGRLAEHCAIQVRLLDGSTIRNRFSSATDTIAEVRKWVDEARTDGRTPYTFKILLTPLPSKTIDASEESQSLRALRLAPSATLIIAPAAGKKYTPAYSASTPVPTVTNNEPVPEGQDHEGGDDNIFIRFIAFIMGIITGIVDIITGFFSTLFSVSGPPQPVNRGERQSQASSSTSTGRDARSGASRIKGLERSRQAERNGDNDQQFYNGNSVSAFLETTTGQDC